MAQKMNTEEIDWGALPNELQATLSGIVSKELFERLDEKESGHIPFFTEEERDTRLIRNMELAIQPYTIKKKVEEPVEYKGKKQEEERFAAVLLKDIPYFHRLFSKEKDPKWLEIAKNLGIAHSKIKRRIETL